MTSAEQELATIGFGKPRSEPACWRTARLDPPVFPARDARVAATEPSCSRALMRWRDKLARNPRPSPYRISRADK